MAHRPDEAIASEAASPARPGRKRDHSRDEAILAATLDVLADVGFDGLTMDMVAARAHASKATVYRRWASKGDLIVDAIARMKHDLVELDQLPDTGSLRGDLLALYRPEPLDVAERRLRIMAGLASLLSHDQTFVEAAHAALVEPWAAAHRALMQRAIDRGEVAPNRDIEMLSRITPALAAYRALILRKPFDLAFLTSVVDGVLMPALGIGDCGVPAASQEEPHPAP